MKSKLHLVLLFVLIALGIMSCSKDNDNDGTPCSVAWSTAISDELNAMSSAAQAYGTNPTPANCLAYKEAAQTYLNALTPFGDCTLLTGQERTAWENAVAQAQEDLDDSEC